MNLQELLLGKNRFTSESLLFLMGTLNPSLFEHSRDSIITKLDFLYSLFKHLGGEIPGDKSLNQSNIFMRLLDETPSMKTIADYCLLEPDAVLNESFLDIDKEHLEFDIQPLVNMRGGEINLRLPYINYPYFLELNLSMLNEMQTLNLSKKLDHLVLIYLEELAHICQLNDAGLSKLLSLGGQLNNHQDTLIELVQRDPLNREDLLQRILESDVAYFFIKFFGNTVIDSSWYKIRKKARDFHALLSATQFTLTSMQHFRNCDTKLVYEFIQLLEDFPEIE